MQTTFPELASSMGKVIPLAGALKVEQEQLFGAMATLTGVTGNTAEVSTQLRGVMQGLLKPSEGMSAALKKIGYESGGAAIESLGLQGTLDALKGSVKGNDTELLKMFGSVEAGGAVLALTGAQADNFTAKTKAMAEAAGATEAAFKIQQATVDAMMKKMNASFDVVMITLGEQLLPMFNTFLTWIIDHMPQIQAFIDKSMKIAGIAFKAVGDFITNTLIPAFKSFWDWIKPYMPLIKDAIKLNFDIMMDIFKLVGDFITNTLVPALKSIWDWVQPHMPQIQASIDRAMKVVRNAFKLVRDFITNTLIPAFKSFWDWVSPYIPKIKSIIVDAFTAIKSIIKQAYDYIKPSFDRLVSTVKNDLMPIIMGLWDTVQKAMPGIKAIFQLVFPLIVLAVKLAIDIIVEVIKVVKGIYDFIKPGLDDVADLFSTIFGGIAKAIQRARDVLAWFNDDEIEDKESTVNTKYTSSGSSSQYGGVGHNANGTDNWRGGLSWVGEEGPELVNLPKGSQVIPNEKSKEMSQGIDITQNFYNKVLSPSEFARQSKRNQQELALSF